MKIADGVEMLEVEFELMGNRSTIHPTLLYDDHHAILVDVGMTGQLAEIEKAVRHAGVPIERIDGVIFTHQDIDHVGGIQDLLNVVGKPIDVYAHAEDKPYIEGEKAPLKMTPERVARMLENAPADVRKKWEAALLHPPTVRVTRTVADGEVLPFFGGLEVIFTPGHTPGHISLYHQPSKTLIAGDATVSQDGRILGPNPQATPNMAEALVSQNRFTQFDIANAICYHGGRCSDDVNGQFRKLAE